MNTQQPKASILLSPLTIAWYWVEVWIHVLKGIALLSLWFPFVNPEQKSKLIREWSLRLLVIFGLQIQINNLKILPSTPYLLASNHISWLDIHAINAMIPVRFVAKSEVANWPIFGWMARQLGTIFIQRNNARHAKHVAGKLAKVLQSEPICIFPEGTSTDGDSVMPFRPNLFEAAILADVPVYPMAINYRSTITGLRSKTAAFIGDMGLLESMSNIIRDRHLIVELSILSPVSSSIDSTRDRKWLALSCHEAIITCLKGDQKLM